MSWEQDMTQKIQELENTPVARFDIVQTLTNTQKNTAKTNIGFVGASATQIEGQDYKITMT